MIILANCLSTHRLLAQADPDVIERVERAVVRIEVTTLDGDSQGSGFVVEDDGVLVTNAHVIANAQKAKAIFPNGRSVAITGIRLCDPTRDIAIVRLIPSQYEVIPLSTQLPKKGETVMALGSPVGLSFTVTRGIVSAVRTAEEMKREVSVDDARGTWVQVDAAISPGNSGGPLINDRGEVVAMSTLASSGTIQNVNFGISATDIRTAVDDTSLKAWQPLTIGAIVRAKRTSSQGGSGGKPSIKQEMAKLPSQPIQEFTDLLDADLPRYKKELALQQTKTKILLRDYRAGEVKPTLFSGKSNENSRRTRDVNLNGRSRHIVYFASQIGKIRAINEAEATLKKLEAANSAKVGVRDEAYFSLLQFAGPALNTRRNESVGVLRGASPKAVLGANEMIIEIDSIPYALVVESTVGTFPGIELEPIVTFVAGILPLETSQSLPVGLTILVQVPESRLRQIVLNQSPSEASESKAAPKTGGKAKIAISNADKIDQGLKEKPASYDPHGVREWNDRSGKFSARGKLISSDGKKATIKLTDGKLIIVDIEKLSEADQRYLKKP